MAQARTFFVGGIPVGQPRPRAFVRCGHASVYNPKTAKGWKQAVGVLSTRARPSQPLTGPVSVALLFVMPRPAGRMRKKDPQGRYHHTAKPDVDNLAKAVLDALTEYRWWDDDSVVAELCVTKMVAAKSNDPTGVCVSVLEDPPLPQRHGVIEFKQVTA